MNPRARRDWERPDNEPGFYLKAKLLKDEGFSKILEGEGLNLKHLQEERARCKEVEAGWIAEAKKRELCHPECSDGYCHHEYMNGIIRAKGDQHS